MRERKPIEPRAERSVANAEAVGGQQPTVSQANASIDTSRTGSPKTPPSGSAERPVPTHFGRYKIETELGKGAMGVVYLAEDTQLHRKVALKIPKKSALEDPEALERFYREARTTATLRHPNICPVYDVGAIEGTHYLTMAYIPGKPVSSFVKPEKLPAARQVALLIRKIALALEEAHKQGVVHRDLKPSNVMLDDRGEPIVMDFGLACQTNTPENARLTQSGAILGTPAYMAPEQVRGDLDQIGPQSDIYALGVMLYQFLTGELPFSGPIMLVFAQIISNEAKKPSELRPDVDPTLEAICLKMMAKEIDQRYSSMKDVAAALTEYVKKGSVTGLETTSTISPTATLNEQIPKFDNLPAFPDLIEESPWRASLKKKWTKTKARGVRAWWNGVRKNPRFWPVAGGGFAAALLFAVVIFIQIGKTKVRIETEGDGSSVVIDVSNGKGVGENAKKGWPADAPTTRSETIPPGEAPVAVLNSDDIEPGAELPVGQWIDVLSMVKLPDDVFTGKWVRNQNSILCEPGPDSRFQVPVALTGSYEFIWGFTRKSGTDVVLISLPIGNRECTLGLSGFNGKRHTLHLIDGRRLEESLITDRAAVQPGTLINGKHYRVHVEVNQEGEKVSISAELDQQRIVNWSGSVSQLSIYPNHTVPNRRCPGICAHTAITEFDQLELRLKEGGKGYRLGDDWKNPMMDVADAPPREIVTKCLDFNGHKYFISEKAISFPEARQLAADLKGRLITISSKEEEAFILKECAGKSLWTAGWRSSVNNEWRDERNRPLRYIGTWEPGQPSGTLYERHMTMWMINGHHGVDDSDGIGKSVHACIEWGEEYPASDAVREALKGSAPKNGTVATRPAEAGWHGWPADAPPPAISPFDAEQAKKHQEEWAKYLGVPVEYTNSIAMKFRLIPPGTLLMGSPATDGSAALAEKPQVKVTLTGPIWLCETEVTQHQFELILGKNPAHFSAGGDGMQAVAGRDTAVHPVEMVSWDDAQLFCKTLSERERQQGRLAAGASYALPSECNGNMPAGPARQHAIGSVTTPIC